MSEDTPKYIWIVTEEDVPQEKNHQEVTQALELNQLKQEITSFLQNLEKKLEQTEVKEIKISVEINAQGKLNLCDEERSTMTFKFKRN